MNYTNSDASVVHVGTGHRMHQSTAPVTTEVSAQDMNQVNWSLMELLNAAGVEPAEFDADDQESYRRVLMSVLYLTGPGNNYLPTVIIADGSDKRAAIVAANAKGRPIFFFGACAVATPVTISVPIIDTTRQIFDLAAKVTIDNGMSVRPEWFGIGNIGALDAAVNALPAGGGVVQLEVATYKPSFYAYGFDGAGSYISKDNVKIRGRKMPSYANDCRSLTGGSVIQGMVLAYASGFELSDLGIDSGKNVVAAFYGNVEAPGFTEALNITFPNNAIKAAAPLKRGIRLHNVATLCSSPSAATHSAIIGEGVTDVLCTGEVIGCYGVHGIVIKCSNVRAEALTSYGNNYEGVIIKSDLQVTAIASDINVGRVVTDANGPPGTTPWATALGAQDYGLLLHASGNNIDSVQIGQLRSVGAKKGIGTSFGGSYAISSVQIGAAFIDQKDVGGIRQGIQLLDGGVGQGSLLRFHVGKAECRNTTVGLQAVFHVGANLQERASIGHLLVVGADNAVDLGNTAYVDIGTLVAEALSDAIFHITGLPSIVLGALQRTTQVPQVYSNLNGGLRPALAGTWSQVSGNDPFGVDLLGGRVNLRGLVKPGGNNLVATLPAWAWPLTPKRFMATGSAAGNQTAVPVVVGADGTVRVNEATGSTANCSEWISLSGVSYSAVA
ncbi:hypothetical protein MW290_18945 [Aquincola tertiaricarbonis]|uniref:Uncharacterized protein n=1 Tax=Aquincola tertiaricarbonis TaxID=391953 RepID=A0ABY4SCJ1_AQUTE|nr:hypothetical protein [Aquincola tertiaricarbonis]URI11048.1 hypothetical protein MW290_18945 [Aquincola tertiaricarbonis]